MRPNNAEIFFHGNGFIFIGGGGFKDVPWTNSMLSNISDLDAAFVIKTFLQKREASEASSDGPAGVPVSCALIYA